MFRLPLPEPLPAEPTRLRFLLRELPPGLVRRLQDAVLHADGSGTFPGALLLGKIRRHEPHGYWLELQFGELLGAKLQDMSDLAHLLALPAHPTPNSLPAAIRQPTEIATGTLISKPRPKRPHEPGA